MLSLSLSLKKYDHPHLLSEPQNTVRAIALAMGQDLLPNVQEPYVPYDIQIE